MSERVDAVVVGAGLGGLAAAVTLAGGAKKTVVLEQHSVPGGYASSFQRGPYRFDTALHELSGLAPGGGVDTLYRQLGIWNRLRLNRLDPLYILRGPDRQIVAPADLFAYEAELIRNFPSQAAVKPVQRRAEQRPRRDERVGFRARRPAGHSRLPARRAASRERNAATPSAAAASNAARACS